MIASLLTASAPLKLVTEMVTVAQCLVDKQQPTHPSQIPSPNANPSGPEFEFNASQAKARAANEASSLAMLETAKPGGGEDVQDASEESAARALCVEGSKFFTDQYTVSTSDELVGRFPVRIRIVESRISESDLRIGFENQICKPDLRIRFETQTSESDLRLRSDDQF